MGEAIRFESVDFCYENSIALKGLSFCIEEGDYVALVGPNGGGKSTLVRLALGLLQPSRGMVFLFGQPQEKFSNRSRIAYVPQNSFAGVRDFPATVREVVSLGVVAGKSFFKKETQEDRAAIESAMAQVGISHLADRLIGQLSGGERQKVFIARALAARPRLLILDEPIVGVDAPSQDSFYALLRRLNGEEGIAIVLVSHDISVVSGQVKKILAVNQELKFFGQPHCILDHSALGNVFGCDKHLIC